MDKETSDAITKGLAYLATAGIAATAGALKYLQEFQTAVRPPWIWRTFCIQVATAVLAGKIAEWLFSGWGVNHNLVLAAVALSGWGGAQAIALASKRLGSKEVSDGSDGAH